MKLALDENFILALAAGIAFTFWQDNHWGGSFVGIVLYLWAGLHDKEK